MAAKKKAVGTPKVSVKTRKPKMSAEQKKALSTVKQTLKKDEVALVSKSGAVEVIKPGSISIGDGFGVGAVQQVQAMLARGDCAGAKMAARSVFAQLRKRRDEPVYSFGGSMRRMAFAQQIDLLKASFKASTCKVSPSGLKGLTRRKGRK